MIVSKSTRLAIAIAILLAAFQLSGCATTLTEEEQYEREARQAESMDKIHGLVAACEGAGMVAVYEGPNISKLRDPTKHIPRNAHLSDYGCASERDIARTLREWGGLRM